LRGGFDGIGFVFDGMLGADGLCYCGVDFDDCIVDGTVPSAAARRRLNRLDTYIEVSPSGTGFHCIARAKPLKRSVKFNGVEVYSTARYFTFTGKGSGEIKAAPAEVAALVDEVRTKQAAAKQQRPNSTSPRAQQFEVPDWAKASKPAQVFSSLDPSNDNLAAGIREQASWYETLPPEQKNEVVDAALSAIARNTKFFELEANGGNNAEYYNLTTAVARSGAPNAEEIFVKWASTAKDADPEDVIKQHFERCRTSRPSGRPISVGTLLHIAQQCGADFGRWKDQGKPSPASPDTVSASGAFRAVPVSSLPLIPRKRQWLHGTDLLRGAVTVLAAPGARAKSTWLLTCALACASGRALLGAYVFGGPLRVLYVSAEDRLDELALRLRAAMRRHGLTDADVAGLYIVGAERWNLHLLRADGNRAALEKDGFSALSAELDHFKPDVLIIDPLINVMGGVNINENAAAALLMGQFVALAATRNISIALTHHTSKGRDPRSAESAMGAASFINLARIALAVEPLEEEEAGELGLPPWEAWSVFRIVGSKQNFSPPHKKNDRWYRLVSVDMPNADPPVYVNGDQVAVVEQFQPGSSGPAFPPALIRDVLAAVDRADPPLSPSKNSKDRYAVPVIAQALAAHRGGRALDTEGKSVLDHLLASNLVHVADVKLNRPGSRGDIRKCLVLTPAGKAALNQPNTPAENTSPQSPQSPATASHENAGGDPLGTPQPQGGCGGSAGRAQ
jgi:hypothetical protein